MIISLQRLKEEPFANTGTSTDFGKVYFNEYFLLLSGTTERNRMLRSSYFTYYFL